MRSAFCAVVLLLLLGGCGESPRPTPVAATLPRAVAAPVVSAGGDPAQDAALYRRALTETTEALHEAKGTKLLTQLVRELSACSSEPARVFARALIDTLSEEGLDAGPKPGPGTPEIKLEELARTDGLAVAMLRTYRGGNDTADREAVSVRMRRRLAQTMVLNAPGDLGACAFIMLEAQGEPAELLTCVRDTTSPEAEAYFLAWHMAAARLSDSSRTATPSTASLMHAADHFTMFILEWYAQVLAADTKYAFSGDELQTLIQGVRRLTALPEQRASSEESQQRSRMTTEDWAGREAMAKRQSDNVRLARAARPAIEKFIAAVVAGDEKSLQSFTDPKSKMNA